MPKEKESLFSKASGWLTDYSIKRAVEAGSAMKPYLNPDYENSLFQSAETINNYNIININIHGNYERVFADERSESVWR